MHLRETILTEKLTAHVLEGRYRLSADVLNITAEGTPVTAGVPEVWTEKNHPYVALSEHSAQFTLQTSTHDNLRLTHRWLTAVFDMAYRTVAEGTYLWPLHTHTATNDDVFGTTLEFSFSEVFLEQLFEKENPSMAYDAFVARLYAHLRERFEVNKQAVRDLYASSTFKHEPLQCRLTERGVAIFIASNPFEFTHLSLTQVTFMHLFLVNLLWAEEAYANGLDVVAAIEEMTQELRLSGKFATTLTEARTYFTEDENYIVARVATFKEIFPDNYGLLLAKNLTDMAYSQPYFTYGFEDMELSTQLLVFDALRFGVFIEILDELDQVIKLSYNGHEEYVKKANITSRVSFVTSENMQNKVVTKKILNEAGIHTPEGQSYESPEAALADYPKYQFSPTVVKPKDGNAGRGIMVFVEPMPYESFEEAVSLAFEVSSSIIVERYYPGVEYRFTVINGKAAAVCARMPANVIGNGLSTIDELIDEKNSHPWRVKKSYSPLAPIEKGDMEKLVLKEQGLTLDSVLEEGDSAFLRHNSNISNGGDSIDYTTEMHTDYKQIAEDVAKALDADVCGVDIIIQDFTAKATLDSYVCIEANGNPGMYIHDYTFTGEGVRVTRHILNMLFPNLHVFEKQVKSDRLSIR